MLKITGKQCQAARGLLKWNLHDLVNHASGLQSKRIVNFERGLIQLLGWENDALVKGFKEAGISFKGDLEVELNGKKAGKIRENATPQGDGARIVLDGEQHVVSDSSTEATPLTLASEVLREEEERKARDKKK